MGNRSPGTQWGDKSRRPRTSWANKPRGWHGHPHQSADAIGVAGTSSSSWCREFDCCQRVSTDTRLSVKLCTGTFQTDAFGTELTLSRALPTRRTSIQKQSKCYWLRRRCAHPFRLAWQKATGRRPKVSLNGLVLWHLYSSLYSFLVYNMSEVRDTLNSLRRVRTFVRWRAQSLDRVCQHTRRGRTWTFRQNSCEVDQTSVCVLHGKSISETVF